jgi:hypothetical protein
MDISGVWPHREEHTQGIVWCGMAASILNISSELPPPRRTWLALPRFWISKPVRRRVNLISDCIRLRRIHRIPFFTM